MIWDDFIARAAAETVGDERIARDRQVTPSGRLGANDPERNREAKANGHDAEAGIIIDDFYAYMPMHNYLYVPTRMPWPASSVNARIPPIPLTSSNGEPVLRDDGKPLVLSASAWLDRFRPVEQMTWAPGMPLVIPNKLVLEGGWSEHRG